MSFLRALFDLSFSDFVTVRVVRWGYVALIVVAALGALGAIVAGAITALDAHERLSALANEPRPSLYAMTAASNDRTAGILAVLGSPPAALLTILLGRVIAEATVVAFSIAESLKVRR